MGPLHTSASRNPQRPSSSWYLPLRECTLAANEVENDVYAALYGEDGSAEPNGHQQHDVHDHVDDAEELEHPNAGICCK
jgi:hypothetical protein